jgi:NmrA-like family
VKRFFPSEFGSNTNLPDVASLPYLQPKIKFAHYVEEKAKQGLIEYTLVNTGFYPWKKSINKLGGLAEYAIKTQFYGINFQNRTFHRIGNGEKLCTFTSLPDVGKYVVAILKRPELSKNADIMVSSYDCNYLSIIELLEKELGEKFTIIEQTPEEQIKAGAPEFLVEMRTMLLDGRGVMGRGGYIVWNDKFPEVKPATLEQVVKQSIKDLTA